MDGWFLHQGLPIGTGLISLLSLGLAALMTVRRLQDRHRLQATMAALQEEREIRIVGERRQRVARQIAHQNALYGLALDNMSQGLLMFDGSKRLIVFNPAVQALFGLSPDSLRVGMHHAEIVRAMADMGCIPRNSIDETIEFYDRLWQKAAPAQLVRRLADGRSLAVNYAPLETGAIVTFEDTTDLRAADERIAHMALHDALTGLPNRVKLRARLEETLSSCKTCSLGGCVGGAAVLCLDLDHFKDVNDTFGHSAGDNLLCQVAARIRGVLRESDLVARLGGDEFAVLLCPTRSVAYVTELAKRIIAAIQVPFTIDGHMVFVGTSIGAALAWQDGNDPEALMKCADLALYSAKNDGRGRVAFFEPSLQQDLSERYRIESELRDAMEQHQLELHYQPIIKVATHTIIGFEALLRWRHPTRGLIPPTVFIPVAEQCGHIVKIGEWVLQEACREAARWPEDLKVAINLSPVQFRSSGLKAAIAKALDLAKLQPARLELEITESAMMHDSDVTLLLLGQLKELGVRITMDDFGTGYSSLAYLRTFPFDSVKIDQSFVHDINQPTNRAIIQAVVGIAESLGITTAAEGVETETQFIGVAQEHCDEAQGYLFSEPLPAAEALAALGRHGFTRGFTDMAAD